MLIRGLMVAVLLVAVGACSRTRYQTPGAEACEVYRAYWGSRDRSELTFLDDRTVHEYTLREEARAPTLWRSYDGGLREFELDTSEMFESLRRNYVQSTHSCFEGRRDRPRRFGGKSIGPLSRARYENGHGGAEIWNLSPVGFSSDGNEAMFLQEIYCGELCGHGQYVLMRKENGKWREVAVSHTWIS